MFKENATTAPTDKTTQRQEWYNPRRICARVTGASELHAYSITTFAGGIGMINVGHSPRNVVNAVKRQLDKFIHTCQIVTTMEAPIQLAELLNRIAPGDFAKKTLLCNSGSEAVENAINIAKYYTQRPAVIVFEGAYHGRWV